MPGPPRTPAFVRLAALVAVVPWVAACVVGPGDDTARVCLALDLGTLDLPADGLPGPRDEDGLLHLDHVPAFVQLAVSGPGLDPPLLAAWPEEGALTPRAAVDFQIDVPVGPQRRFEFLAYVYERREGRVRAWTDDGTIVRDLLAGGVEVRIDVTLRQLGRGSIGGTVEGAGAAGVVAVVAVDGDPGAGVEGGPGIALPPAEVVDGAFEIPDAPVGRSLTFRVERADGTCVRTTTAAVRLAADGERSDVVVQAP